MMNTDYFKNLVDQKILAIHTLYLAKVLSINRRNNVIISATVKPLAKIKAYGKAAKEQAVIENVPVLNHARSGMTIGKVACCACIERDITQTKRGVISLPSKRHHSLSDSVIIGILEV